MKLFSALQSKLASHAPMVLPVLPRDSDSEDSDDEYKFNLHLNKQVTRVNFLFSTESTSRSSSAFSAYSFAGSALQSYTLSWSPHEDSDASKFNANP